MSIIQGTSKAAGGGYTIENSVRLDGVGDMSRTVGSDGDLREWSWSFWVKRSGLGTNGSLGFNIGGTYVDASNRSIVRFYSSGNGTDDFYWAERSGGAWREDQWTDAQYRDPSAWYHILLVWDTDGGTTPRARRYINGVQITDLGSSPAAAANADSGTNKAGTFQLFDQAGFPGREFEGYCAEMHFVDGSALEPTDFGEFNTDGVWIPKQVTGITYGSNGFYLDFADSSDLGNDVSGNGNDFTSSGLTTADQMLDTPTNNFCTWNPLKTNSSATLSDGNLNYTASGAQRTTSTFAVNSGKWYAEFTISAATGSQTWGVVDIAQVSLSDAYIGQRSYEWGIDGLARTYNNGSNAANYTDFSASDVIGIALDMDNGKVWFRGNDGTFLSGGDPAAGTTPDFSGLSGDICFAAQFTGGNVTINCGQSAYTNAPPTGFNALSTANLATPSITDGSAHFQPTLYTGTGSSLAVTQSGNSTFQPDWVWIKGRSGATEHVLTDAVRGVTKELSSNDTGAEETVAQGLTTFGSAGFTVGTDGSYNTSSATYVGWQWKANGAGSSNTDGSITSTVSANTTAGFSIVKYAGNLSTTGSATVGHGLGTAPLVVISKSLDSTAGDSGGWSVQHTSLPASNILRLNTTAATSDKSGNGTLSSPTSTVFYTNYTEGLNVTGNDYIAYCFAEIPGYSSFGSYTGNGSTDGPMIFTSGMKPAWLTVKRAVGGTGNWDMFDIKRDPINPADAVLDADSSGAEASYATIDFDFLSNGFKVRGTQSNINASGSTYIYMAFAENPFGGDGVAPATAR
jgi:hypothetical protein